MAQETGPAMGMSVGATTLAAVTADHAITRRPVLTLFRDRPSQIGLPSENSDLLDRGLVVSEFVDRVGGGSPVVANDGSTHRPEQLLADGLHALAYCVTEGRPIPPAVAVTYPAHWSREAVGALRTALARVAEWAQHPVSLISDTAAVLTALQANPGLPDRGVIAVCDFGGSGTSITLVDASRGFEPLGPTRRSATLSGDVVDQALLDHVVADLGDNGDGPATVGSLTRLRNQCRDAKEQLSIETVAEVAGFHGGVWLTRAELDEALRLPFQNFLAILQGVLEDNGVRSDALAAIVSVGGGANMPTVTTGLSQHFGVTVISSPRPQLTAAIGAALSVAGDVAPAPKAPPPVAPAPVPETVAPPEYPLPPPIAQDVGDPGLQPVVTPPLRPAPVVPSQPVVPVLETPEGQATVQWYRRPVPIVVLAALIAIVLGTAAVFVLRRVAEPGPSPSVPTTTYTTTTSPSPTFEPPPAPLPEPVVPEPAVPEPAVPGPAEPPVNPENPGNPLPEPTEAPPTP